MKRVDRKRRKVRLWVALGFIFLAAVTVLADRMTKDKEFSEEENRMLTGKPEISMETVANGKFMSQYEKYKSDQFLARDFWVSLKTNVDLLLGKRESNGVFKGEDGYLLEDISVTDERAYKENMDAVTAFAGKYPDLKMHMMIVPNAANILKEKLPAFAVTEDQDAQLRKTEEIVSGAGIRWIDVSEPLKAHKDEEIYYRTDHHWTTKGAYYAFQASAEALGIPGEELKPLEPYTVSGEFNGTLSATSGYERGRRENIEIYLPKGEQTEVVVNYVEEKEKSASMYSSEKLKEKDKYGMFLNGNHALVDIKTTSEKNRRLLVLKDSYANCFVPFLTPYYREIVLVDPRYYYGDLDELIEEDRITDVLFLYNGNTFFTDNNLSGVLESE
nr:DHHW family protein [uncultured Faecalimonas sp.]